MWTRKELKTKGKMHFQANYWPTVFASAVIALLTAGSASSSKGDTSSEDIAALASQVGISTELFLGILFGVLGASLVVGIIIKLLLINPLKVGAKGLYLKNINDEKPKALSIFGVFKGNFVNVGLTMFLKDLIIGLWTLLLIIPGIIKGIEYSMVDYILAENPETTWGEAKKMSSQMTKGHKWNIFVLGLSFIGWYILSACTVGILGIFYVNPYVDQTGAELYDTLKGGQTEEI